MPKSTSRNRKNVLLIILLVAIGLLILLPGTHESRNSDSEPQTTNTAQTPYNTPTDSSAKDSLSSDRVNLSRLKERLQSLNAPAIDAAGLSSQINAIIAANPDVIFGVSIKHVNSGEFYNYGNQAAMTSASVSKVLTAVDYFKQVEAGNKSLEATMPNGSSAISCIEDMIVVSNNACWEYLNESLTYSQMQNYAESIGLSSYDYTDNALSAADTSKLFSDLYQRLLINESNTQSLLAFMERANYRDLIIPAVPEQDSVYHKAGELYTHLNDAAIITDTKKAVVLSIYTDSQAGYSKSRISSLMQQITDVTLKTFGLK